MPYIEPFVFLGPVIAIVGMLCHWWRYRQITIGGESADAAVIAVSDEEDSQSTDRVIRPTVEFYTRDGTMQTATCSGYSDTSRNRGAFKAFHTVRILYHPTRPSSVILSNRYCDTYIALAVFALTWFSAAILMLRYPSP